MHRQLLIKENGCILDKRVRRWSTGGVTLRNWKMHLPSFQAATAQKPPVLLLQPTSSPRGSGPQPLAVLPWRVQDFILFFLLLPPYSPLTHLLSAKHPDPHPSSADVGFGPAPTNQYSAPGVFPTPAATPGASLFSSSAPSGPRHPTAPTSSPGITAGAPHRLCPGASLAALRIAAGRPSNASLSHSLVAAQSCTSAAGRGRPAPGSQAACSGRPALRIPETTLWRGSTPL